MSNLQSSDCRWWGTDRWEASCVVSIWMWGWGLWAESLRGNCGDVTLSLWWTETQDVEPSVSMGFGVITCRGGKEAGWGTKGIEATVACRCRWKPSTLFIDLNRVNTCERIARIYSPTWDCALHVAAMGYEILQHSDAPFWVFDWNSFWALIDQSKVKTLISFFLLSFRIIKSWRPWVRQSLLE